MAVGHYREGRIGKREDGAAVNSAGAVHVLRLDLHARTRTALVVVERLDAEMPREGVAFDEVCEIVHRDLSLDSGGPVAGSAQPRLGERPSDEPRAFGHRGAGVRAAVGEVEG